MLKQLVSNSGSNLAVFFIKLVITFIMTPIFVKNLGDYDYGIWAIVGSIIGYMGMLDLGLLPTISRFVAHHSALKEQNEVRKVYSTSLIFLGTIGLLMGIGLAVWGTLDSSSLDYNSTNDNKYQIFIYFISIQVFFTFVNFVYVSFLTGMQRYPAMNNIIIVNSIIGSTVVFVFISPENALLLVSAMNGLGIAIKVFWYRRLIHKSEFGNIKFDPECVSLVKLKELLSFGIKSFIQGASSRISRNADSFVIVWSAGTASVIFYAMPANLVRHVSAFILNITHVFMPFFSDLNARGDQKAILSVFLSASRYVVALIVMFSIVTCMIGPEFIGIWVGDKYQEPGRYILYIMMIYTAVPLLNPFAGRYLTAINRHVVFAKLEPVNALINIFLSVTLSINFGLEGIAMGTLIPVVLVHAFYLIETCRNLNITVWHYIKLCWIPCLLPAVVIIALVLQLKKEFIIDGYFDLVFIGGVSSLCYLATFLIFSVQSDKQFLFQVYSRFKTRRA